MKKIIGALIGVAYCMSPVFGQTSGEKAGAIAAEFSKKNEGITTGKSKVVEARPDIRESESSYAGKYELDGLSHYLVFRQVANGQWEMDYFTVQDNQTTRQATGKDIKIDSALLTATLSHIDGRVLPFQGAFISSFENGERTDGFGIRQVLKLSSGFTVDKAFYKKTE